MKTLFEAIESADAGAVWNLARERGTDLQAVDESTGLTPLALASEAGLSEIVRTLLEAGADPNVGGATTPLEAAVVEGHLDVVEALIAGAADVNQKVEEGFTPLMTAAATGNLPLVKVLLAAGARPRLLNEDRASAISLAQDAGHDDVVEELRAAGRRLRAAKLEAASVAAAAEEDLEDTEEITAEEIAAEEARSAESRSAESTSAESRSAESLSEDRESRVTADPEPESIASDATSGLRLGLHELPASTTVSKAKAAPPAEEVEDDSTETDDIADLFALDDDGGGVPGLGGASDDEDDGEDLFGAPMDLMDADLPDPVVEASEPPVQEYAAPVDDFSVSLGDFEAVLDQFEELGEASGAEIRDFVAEHRDVVDDAGRTLLMAAAFRGQIRMVQALIASGVDVNASERTESGRTALVYAARSEASQRIEIISLLVDAGADVNQRCGRNRRNALMHAAEADVYLDRPPEPVFAQTTKELIRLGANLEARDRQGRTVWKLVKRDAIGAPTFSASRRRLHQMLRVLEYNGAQQIASHKM